MAKSSFAVTLSSLAWLAAFVPGVGAQPPARTVPAQVLVQFRPGVSEAQAQAVINAHQGRSIRLGLFGGDSFQSGRLYWHQELYKYCQRRFA